MVADRCREVPDDFTDRSPAGTTWPATLRNVASKACEHEPSPHREKDRLTLIVFCVMCVIWLALTVRAHFDLPAAATPAAKAHVINVVRQATTAPPAHR